MRVQVEESAVLRPGHDDKHGNRRTHGGSRGGQGVESEGE